jgi:hypothetical protein
MKTTPENENHQPDNRNEDPGKGGEIDRASLAAHKVAGYGDDGWAYTHLHVDRDGTAVATDSFALVAVEPPARSEPGTQAVLLPKDAVKDLTRVLTPLGKTAKVTDVESGESDEQCDIVKVQTGVHCLRYHAAPLSFPHYKSVVPSPLQAGGDGVRLVFPLRRLKAVVDALHAAARDTRTSAPEVELTLCGRDCRGPALLRMTIGDARRVVGVIMPLPESRQDWTPNDWESDTFTRW